MLWARCLSTTIHSYQPFFSQLGVNMNCSTNTMLKVATGLGLTLGAAYFTFPAAQTIILTYAPFLLALICPISMGVMVIMMKGTGQSKSNGNACASAGVSRMTKDPQAAVPGKV